MSALNVAERFLKRLPQHTRLHRHFRSALVHGTPRKWANLLRVEWERKRRRVEVKGVPYILFLDPCNYCNLRCPLCPTGANDLGRPQTMMSLEQFQRYFDPFAPYLFEVNLHNWGESLLNKEVFQMIRYAQSRNVGTNLSSNFVKVDDQDIDNILDAGLEYLTISLDGTHQESYEKYRVRGDYERVIENVSKLIKRRREQKKRTPFVEWQFIVMRHNEHEIPEATRIAEKLGVDLLRFIPVGLPYDATNRQELAAAWFPQNVKGRTVSDGNEPQFAQHEKPGPCFYLYRSFVINADGGVSPCCIVYRETTDFANLKGTESVDVHEIYNNPMYRSGRALFRPEKSVGHVPTTCDGCDIFARPQANAIRKPPSRQPATVSTFVSVDELAASGVNQARPTKTETVTKQT
ncbi:MAG: radical SAM protein [Pirellulaceae bacterium]|nr:radical SAM protein [Planctomycetales bacterium]